MEIPKMPIWQTMWLEIGMIKYYVKKWKFSIVAYCD